MGEKNVETIPLGDKEMDRLEKAEDTPFIACAPEKKNFFRAFVDQMAVMLKRNYLLQVRYAKSTLSQTIIAPFIFMLCLLILQQADYSIQRQSVSNPVPYDLQGVATCRGKTTTDPCINILFTPNTEPYTTIMNTFAIKNANRTGNARFEMESELRDVNTLPTKVLGMVPVPDAAFLYDYTLKNPNATQWGISFNQTTEPVNIQYQIWFNSSQTLNSTDVFGTSLISFMRALDESIISVLNDGSGATSAEWTIQLKDWPTIPPTQVVDTIIQELGPCFFFCSVMVIFINVLNQIVSEKELKLRHGLEVMGLQPCVYWISNYLSISLLVAVNSLFTVVFGLICGFSTFRNANFGVLFFIFFLFGESMVMFAFFITTLVRTSKTAVLFGIFLFVIGLLFESFVFSGSVIGYIWWDVNTTPVIWKVLLLLPFFNFGKAFLDVTTMTVGKLDSLTQTYIPGPGYGWNDLYEALPEDLKPTYSSEVSVPIPPTVDALYYCLLDMAIYAVLTWYFDRVLPDEFGSCLPPWFPLLPSYWGISFGASADQREEAQRKWLALMLKEKNPCREADLDGEDEQVKDERGAVVAGFQPMKIVNLRKCFSGGLFKRDEKVAVKSLSLGFEEGKLLALLGQNGAGKSTTMNILSGLTPSSSGDANIYGFSVRREMGAIRNLMGICPQHDILFADLTAREHIWLYAGVKGIAARDVAGLVESRLKAVRLWNVADQRAGTFSGGMKRRLSVAISTIGDPKVVFLDEMTTGMDPQNRRHVWAFIEKFKQNRIVVMTTHSMEEADVLGDRIAIMAHGKLRALGNSISLKNKYGAGYRITVVTAAEHMSHAKAAIETRVPGATLEDDSAGALIYRLPLTSTLLIPALVSYMETNPDKIIKTWGLSQTTLEEVFLKIIREANPNGYSGNEQ